MSAFSWAEILKEAPATEATREDFEAEAPTQPHTHSPLSVYFGWTTVNPPWDMSCSCFMVEQTQLPFVWWDSCWPLTPGFVLAFKRKGLCGVFVFTSMWQGLFLSRAPLCLDNRTAAELLWPQALELQVHTLGSEKGPLESPPRSVEATSQAWKCQECEEEYLYR